MNQLTVWIPAEAHEAEVQLASVGLEIQSQHYERSEVSLTYEEGRLVLRITAEDATALRAGYNSYLRLLDASLGLIKQ